MTTAATTLAAADDLIDMPLGGKSNRDHRIWVDRLKQLGGPE